MQSSQHGQRPLCPNSKLSELRAMVWRAASSSSSPPSSSSSPSTFFYLRLHSSAFFYLPYLLYLLYLLYFVYLLDLLLPSSGGQRPRNCKDAQRAVRSYVREVLEPAVERMERQWRASEDTKSLRICASRLADISPDECSWSAVKGWAQMRLQGFLLWRRIRTAQRLRYMQEPWGMHAAALVCRVRWGL